MLTQHQVKETFFSPICWSLAGKLQTQLDNQSVVRHAAYKAVM